MKSLLLFLPFVALTLACSQESIVGNWQAVPSGAFIEFTEKGEYAGNFIHTTELKKTGSYTVLKDGSGVVMYSGQYPVIYNIRELEKDRMILTFENRAFILKRLTGDDLEGRVSELKEKERKEKFIFNLRKIASTGQQYFLETGANKVSFVDLEKEYKMKIDPINGEDYESLIVHAEGGVLKITTAEGEEFEYKY